MILAQSLIEDPFQDDKLGKDCFKVRMKISSKSKSKSGGSRVITCVKVTDAHIKLLSIYGKSEKSSISDAFLIQLLTESGLI